MKKILSLLVLMVALTSCEEDVQFNNPAVQALKDNELWRAADFTAIKGSDNSLTIRASNGFETVTLKAASIDPGVCLGNNEGDGTGCGYTLGENEINSASYVLAADGIEMAYRTGTDIGNGRIIINNDPRDTNIARGFVSGRFYFNAFDNAGNVVNFQQGVFYRVPITIIP